MKEVMDTADVAELLSVNVKTVRRWLNDGKLPGANIPGVGYRVTAKDVETFLNNHRRRVQSDEL